MYRRLSKAERITWNTSSCQSTSASALSIVLSVSERCALRCYGRKRWKTNRDFREELCRPGIGMPVPGPRLYSSSPAQRPASTNSAAEATDLRRKVIPLVLIIALSIQQKYKEIAILARESHEHHRWFDLISKLLLKGTSPITSVTLKTGRILNSTTLSPSRKTLKVSELS